MKQFILYGLACCFLAWLINRSVYWLVEVWHYLAIGGGILVLIIAIYLLFKRRQDWR